MRAFIVVVAPSLNASVPITSRRSAYISSKVTKGRASMLMAAPTRTAGALAIITRSFKIYIKMRFKIYTR